MVDSARCQALALLTWFARHARDLPWRRTRDPYAIWVSEIMLQQTQVRTVVPYWERWMRALPDARALARARLERVLKLWEGLGYYTRARNLHRAARAIVERHGGRFPRSFEQVLALPGVGRYTAGAICSLAFNQPVPVLDGNVARVLARLVALDGHPKAAATRQQLWALAGRLVQAARVLPLVRTPLARAGNCSALNQALMELGAVVCTPRRPNCPACPLRRWCQARRQGCPEGYPERTSRPRPRATRVVAVVAECKGRFLVRQRGATGVNAQLWEFPCAEVPDGPPDDARRLVARVVGAETGLKLAGLRPLCTVRHSITQHRITLTAYRGEVVERPRRRSAAGRWLTLAEIEARPFPAAHRRILEALRTGARVRD